MPDKPRRRLTRRAAPPRPTYPGAAGAPEGVAVAAAPTRRTASASRPAEYVARQTPYLWNEMRRVGLISAVCFGMLALLVVVDRLQ